MPDDTVLYDDLLPLTEDDFIGGRVRLRQPKQGYRVSMDTVLLAAAVQARPGEKVLEAGTGSAGASICIGWRCPEVSVTGLELQPSMAALARDNIALNGMEDRINIIEGDIMAPPASLMPESFDHVLANPPYIEKGCGLRAPAASKGLAHMDSTASLADWVRFCLRMVKKKGTVYFVFRADRVDALIRAMGKQVGDITLCPLWPREGVPAKRILIQARKEMHGVMALSAGFPLHGDVSRYTAEAEAVLRDGHAIDLNRARRGEKGVIVAPMHQDKTE